MYIKINVDGLFDLDVEKGCNFICKKSLSSE